MTQTYVNDFLWAAGPIGDSLLLFVLFFRRRARDLPIFSGLILFNLTRTVALYLILRFGTAAEYFYTYWGLAIVDTAIQFAVGYEVAASVFRPSGAWAIDIKSRLIAWTIVSMVVAGALTQLQQPPGSYWLASVILKASFFSATLLSELFVGMIALSSIAGLNWRSHVARISEGLGIYSFSNVLIEAANTIFGFGSEGEIYNTLQTFRKGLYVVCLIYWSVTLWRDAPPVRRLTKTMRDQVSAIREVLTNRLNTLDSENDR